MTASFWYWCKFFPTRKVDPFTKGCIKEIHVCGECQELTRGTRTGVES